MNESMLGFRFIQPATDGKTLVGVMASPAPTTGAYIVAIDLATGIAQTITDKLGAYDHPQVSDQYIVWLDHYELKFYDRTSDQFGTVNVKGKARNPSLSGTTVVWEKLPEASGSTQIWGYDLLTGRDFPVVTDKPAAKPVISGRWVVLSSAGGLNAINLDTGEKIALGRLQPLNRYLYSLYALDAPWVVWTFGEGDDRPLLHLYNLDTHQDSSVVVSSCSFNGQTGRPQQAVISTPIVIFMGCGQDLGYDYETGTYFSVPIDSMQTQSGGFLGWTFAKGQLVWAAGPAQIYSVSVTGGK